MKLVHVLYLLPFILVGSVFAENCGDEAEYINSSVKLHREDGSLKIQTGAGLVKYTDVDNGQDSRHFRLCRVFGLSEDNAFYLIVKG